MSTIKLNPVNKAQESMGTVIEFSVPADLLAQAVVKPQDLTNFLRTDAECIEAAVAACGSNPSWYQLTKADVKAMRDGGTPNIITTIAGRVGPRTVTVTPPGARLPVAPSAPPAPPAPALKPAADVLAALLSTMPDVLHDTFTQAWQQSRAAAIAALPSLTPEQEQAITDARTAHEQAQAHLDALLAQVEQARTVLANAADALTQASEPAAAVVKANREFVAQWGITPPVTETVADTDTDTGADAPAA